MGMPLNPDHARHLTLHELKLYQRAWLTLDVGEQVCKRLQKKRWTEGTLSKRTGISKRRLKEILQGKPPTSDELSDIALAFGCYADVEFKPLGFRPRTSNKPLPLPIYTISVDGRALKVKP